MVGFKVWASLADGGEVVANTLSCLSIRRVTDAGKEVCLFRQLNPPFPIPTADVGLLQVL